MKSGKHETSTQLIYWHVTHETTQSNKVIDTGGSPKREREDKYDSQSRPQEFKHLLEE